MAGEDWDYEERTIPKYVPREQIRFQDVNPDFTLNGKPLILENDEALKAQIRHVLSTPTGTEHFEPRFGSRLPYRLFEPIAPLTGALMELDTIIALRMWLPGRVFVPAAQITPLTAQDGYFIMMPIQRVETGAGSLFAFSMLR